jgi:hypothetical protein
MGWTEELVSVVALFSVMRLATLGHNQTLVVFSKIDTR